MNNLSTTAYSAPAVTGAVHGGPNPVVGATVNLYATSTNGYGSSNVTLLGTSLPTDANGNFTIVRNSATCTSPQQEYLVSTGGNPGAGSNSNYVFVAAVGDCSQVSSSTIVFMNEVSTVAAAYALANFATTSGNNIYIGAPNTADLQHGSCTNAVSNGITTIGTCTSAGLVHAFGNAQMLTNTVGTSTYLPTGQANQVPTIPALGSVTTPNANANGEVPAALINTLANIVEGCVNSTGGSSSDTSTTCGKLFSYTTPAGGTAPTNIFQAMVNLAKNPTLQTSNLYALQTANTSFYSPNLSSQPNDFSLALIYKGITTTSGGVATSTSFGYPYGLTLDADDNVFISVTDASSATKSGVAGMYPNGQAMFAPTFSTNYKSPRSIAADNLGNVWVTNNGGTGGVTGTAGVLQYVVANPGAANVYGYNTPFPYAVAIDRQNNVWFSTTNANGPSLTQLLQDNSYNAATFSNPPAYTAGPYGIAIDQFQNVWTANAYPYSGSSAVTSSIGLFVNTGTTTAPAYNSAAISDTTATGVFGFAIPSVDGGGNVYVPASTNSSNSMNLYQAVATPNGPNPSSFVVNGPFLTAASSGTTVGPRGTEVDGSGTVWMTDFNGLSSQLVSYSPTTTATVGIKPCRAGSGATTCNTSAPALYNPRNLAIDSSGDIWSANSTDGLITVVLGTASPAFPLLAAGHQGVKP